MFVPTPSLAKTEPLTNITEAEPRALALNVIRSNAPSAPLNPGEGTPPVKLIVPVAMDKGLRFAIREGGRTVGAGQVTEIIK